MWSELATRGSALRLFLRARVVAADRATHTNKTLLHAQRAHSHAKFAPPHKTKHKELLRRGTAQATSVPNAELVPMLEAALDDGAALLALFEDPAALEGLSARLLEVCLFVGVTQEQSMIIVWCELSFLTTNQTFQNPQNNEQQASKLVTDAEDVDSVASEVAFMRTAFMSLPPTHDVP
jgi:hypothetical protein